MGFFKVDSSTPKKAFAVWRVRFKSDTKTELLSPIVGFNLKKSVPIS